MLDKNFDDVISEIPDYFYPAFAGELVSVFGADVLKHQLEVARQRVQDCQRIINKLKLDMHVLDVGVKK